MQFKTRRSEQLRVLERPEQNEPSWYASWCNTLYPAQASGCTLTSCNSVTVQNAVNSTSASVTPSYSTATSSAVNATTWIGSVVGSLIAHAPGAIRDYVIGAGQSINLFPIYTYEIFETSDYDALRSDVAIVCGDINHGLADHWTEFLGSVRAEQSTQAVKAPHHGSRESGERIRRGVGTTGRAE